MRITRRQILRMLAGTTLIAAGGRRGWTATEKDPIRVGFLVPFTGPFAQSGKDMWDGFRLYFEEIGMRAGGRRIELISEDTWVEPAGALTKLRKLAERDRVHVAAGGLLAATGLALQPYVLSQRLPFIVTNAADDITQRKIIPWYIRTHYSCSQVTHPLGHYANATLGYRRVAGLNFDYAFGHETFGGFQRAFEEMGGKVVQKLWAPIATTDFAPYLPLLKRDVDAIFSSILGAPALRLLKQLAEYGIKGKIAIVGHGVLTDEALLPSMGDEGLGVVTALNYSTALNTPANRAFLAAFEKATGRSPSAFSAYTYSAARWMAEGMKAVGGDVEDKDRFLAALKKVSLQDDPRGPIQIDQYGSPIQNIYIRKVEQVGGRLRNTVVHTYPNVGQFWTYGKEKFLAQPVYDRDFPPCKYCQ